jgi:kynurenine formamidase
MAPLVGSWLIKRPTAGVTIDGLNATPGHSSPAFVLQSGVGAPVLGFFRLFQTRPFELHQKVGDKISHEDIRNDKGVPQKRHMIGLP